tara:strand:- start:187 stop:795 length:609 start_codon:yes stop_codon:yes gene_type:complete
MGNGNKAEMLIAICAVITSVVALFIGWDQARLMRLQQRADVWPILQITHQTDINSDMVSYAVEFRNAGVGPALIEAHYILIPGRRGSASFGELVDYSIPESFGAPFLATASIDGRVIRQGDFLLPISANWPATEETTAGLQERVKQFVSGELEPAVVFSCFCSILEECWISSTLQHQSRPKPVKSCSALERDAKDLLAEYGS